MALTKDLKNLFNQREQEFGLPSGTLTAIAKIESDFNPNAKADGSSAAGMFQITKGTAKTLGVKDPYDVLDASRGAAKYISDLKNRYGGDIRKAVLAYHAGPGNVDKFGLDTSNMPKAVQRNYLQHFTTAYQKASGDKFPVSEESATTINNNTAIAASSSDSSTSNDIKPPSPEELRALRAYMEQQNSTNIKTAGGNRSSGDAVVDAQNDASTQDFSNAGVGSISVPDATQTIPQDLTSGNITSASQPDQSVQGVYTNGNPLEQAPAAPAQPVSLNNNVQPQTLTNAAVGSEMPAANNSAQVENNMNVINQEASATNNGIKPPSPEELRALRAYMQQQTPTQTNSQPTTINNSLIVADGPDKSRNDFFNAPNRAKFLDYFSKKSADEQAKLYIQYRNANNTSALDTINRYYDYLGETKDGKPSGFTNFLQGFGDTGYDMAMKLGQAFSYAKGKLTGDMSGYNEIADKADREQVIRDLNNRVDPSIARNIGELAAGFVAPELRVAKGAGLAAKVINRAATGAVVGAVSKPVTNEDFLTETAKDAGIAAGLNVGLGAVGDKVGGWIGSRINRKEAAQALSDTAERNAYKQDASDLGVKTLATDGPNVPADVQSKINDLASTNDVVREQVANNLVGYRKVLTDLRDKFSTVKSDDFIDNVAPDIRSHANDIDSPYYKDAKDLVSKASSTDSTDAPNTLKNVLATQLLGNRIKSDQLYQDAASSLNPREVFIDMSNFRKALSSIKHEADYVVNSTNNEGILNGIYKSFQRRGEETSGKDLYSTGYSTPYKRYDLKNTGQFVKELNNSIGDAMKSGSRTQLEAYRNLKAALLQDMQDFSVKNANSSNPNIADYVNKESLARRYNANAIQTIKNDVQYNKVLDSNNIDSFVNNLLKNRTQLNDFMNSDILPNEAKQTIRLATFNNLLGKSINKSDEFNPESFVNEYNKLKSVVGNKSHLDTIFESGTVKKMDQLNNVLKNLNAYKAYATSNVSTGNKVNNALARSKGNLTGGSTAALATLTSGSGIVGIASGIAAKAFTERASNKLAKAVIEPGNDKLVFTLAHANPKSQKYADALGELMGRSGQTAIQSDYVDEKL